MQGIDLSDVRSFALLGHTHSGKTTLLDAILAHLNIGDQKGSVDKQTSQADYTPEEKEHGITIWPKSFNVTYTTHTQHKSEMVIVDSPGYGEFYGGIVAATRATDAGLIVIDASAGIQVGTARAWRRCENRKLPRGIVITGLDKPGSDFDNTLLQIQSAWGDNCLPVTLPTSDNRGVISLLEAGSIPDELKDKVAEIKGKILEDIAETDDSLIEKYLGGEELSKEEYAKGLHTAVNTRVLVPVFAAYPTTGLGIEELLEAIHHSFPSPDDHDVFDATGQVIEVGKDAPFSGIVWRILNDPYIGQMSFVRVMSGTLKSDSEVFNPGKNETERIGHMSIINGKNPTAIKEAHAGDIIAVPRLKHTTVNDSLCATGHTIMIEPLHFPTPVMSCAVSMAKKGEEDKLSTALHRTPHEDPSIHVDRHPETGELLISGLGEMHLNVTVEHIKNRHNIDIILSPPKVAYRETVTSKGEGHYRHKKQSGGRGQFGEVYLTVENRNPADEKWFVDHLKGGAIPSNFVPAVEKGLSEALRAGAQGGYPVENVKITVYDGSHHAVDSSEVAFKIAAAKAFREAMLKARPILLEPIMACAITVPPQNLGDITGDLSHRRGQVVGIEEDHGLQVIKAEVPQAELHRYSSELRSMTSGRSSLEMHFLRYDPVPGNISQRVLEERDGQLAAARSS